MLGFGLGFNSQLLFPSSRQGPFKPMHPAQGQVAPSQPDEPGRQLTFGGGSLNPQSLPLPLAAPSVPRSSQPIEARSSVPYGTSPTTNRPERQIIEEPPPRSIYESPATHLEPRQAPGARPLLANSLLRESNEAESPGSQHPLTRTLQSGPDSQDRAFRNVSFQRMKYETSAYRREK